MSKSEYVINFKVNQTEWNDFWSWMENNTNVRFGPLTNPVYTSPRENHNNERAMYFFLKYKEYILNTPPFGKNKEKFNQLVADFK